MSHDTHSSTNTCSTPRRSDSGATPLRPDAARRQRGEVNLSVLVAAAGVMLVATAYAPLVDTFNACLEYAAQALGSFCDPATWWPSERF